MSKTTKQIIIIVILVIIAFVAYKKFFPSQSEGTLEADSKSSQQVAEGQAILILLNQLEKVELNDAVFSNKVFTNLVSFEKTIREEPIGRENPFLPIGMSASALRSTSTVRGR